MKSIKNKIIAFSVIATLIPSLALGLLSFRQNEELISNNVTRDLLAVARNVSRELDLWVNENSHAIRAISVSNLIINSLSEAQEAPSMLRNSENTQEILALFLRSVQGKLKTILELTVVDTEGKIFASSTVNPDIADLPDNWYQGSVLTEGVIVSSPHLSTRYNTAIFNIVVPILSYDDVLIGSIVATLDLGIFKDSLEDTFYLSSSKIILLDQSARVLLTNDVESTISTSLDAQLFQQLKLKTGESMIFNGLTHSTVIGLVSVSKELPLIVLIEQDYAEVYEAWARLRNFFLGFVSILIVIVAAVALYIGRSIVIPLVSLISATKHIVDGDLNVRVEVKQSDEVGQLALMFNQMTDKLHQNHLEITAANESMRQQNLLLEELSVTDSLTGLFNRSKLDSILSDQLARYERNKRSFSVMMIDVDHFKTLNDNLGHIVGDEILIAVAKILANSVRSIDFAARYGGDEFVVILTETTAEIAMKTAERIRKQVAEIGSKLNIHEIPITLSIGITHCQAEDKTPTTLLTRVDSALYEAKKAGRNRMHIIT